MVVINDMSMPQSCIKCPFSEGSFSNGVMTLHCVTNTGRYMYAPDLINRTDRPEWCPLHDNVAGVKRNDALDGMFRESFEALDRMEEEIRRKE